MSLDTSKLRDVATQFAVYGDFKSVERYGDGHINDTYRLILDQAGTEVPYILQRINTAVFTNVPALMNNIGRVLDHLRGASGMTDADASRRRLSLVPTRAGSRYLTDSVGQCWRMYLFIGHARTYTIIKHTAMAEAAAAAFGRFQRLLADLPEPRLHETINRFHDTPDRYRKLETAVAADVAGRRSLVAREIDFAVTRAETAARLIRLHQAGDIPERITHNDTKLNNVMIDDRTGEGICVIDLDTVMPGLTPYDFGDMVRSACNSGAEDATDPGRTDFLFPVFEALARGYLREANAFLTAPERRSLAVAGWHMTLECGVRFLTDFLEGDTYFRTSRPHQNLDRCRVHFRLVDLMEAQANAIDRVIRDAC